MRRSRASLTVRNGFCSAHGLLYICCDVRYLLKKQLTCGHMLARLFSGYMQEVYISNFTTITKYKKKKKILPPPQMVHIMEYLIYNFMRWHTLRSPWLRLCVRLNIHKSVKKKLVTSNVFCKIVSAWLGGCTARAEFWAGWNCFVRVEPFKEI